MNSTVVQRSIRKALVPTSVAAVGGAVFVIDHVLREDIPALSLAVIVTGLIAMVFLIYFIFSVAGYRISADAVDARWPLFLSITTIVAVFVGAIILFALGRLKS